MSDRLGPRAAVIVALLPVVVLVLAGAYQFLSRSAEQNIGERLDERAAAAAVVLSTAMTDQTAVDLVSAVADEQDVRSIHVIDASAGTVLASSETLAGQPIADVPDPALRSVLQAARSGTSLADDTRALNLEGLGDAFEAAQPVLVVEFDRDAAGSDLRDATRDALLTLVAGASVILGTAYVLTGALITRRLSRVAGRLRTADTEAPRERSSSEILELERLVARAIERAEKAGSAPLTIASRLPAMWIQLDSSLRVLDSQVEVEPDTSADSASLSIGELGELLSDGVVDHVRELAVRLIPGTTSAFEFAVGHRIYGAQLRRLDEDVFELEIGESEAWESEPATVSHGAVDDGLDALLGDLPFILIELDGRGVIEWANSNYLEHSPESLPGRPLVDVVPAESVAAVREALRAATVDGLRATFAVDAHRDGTVQRWSHAITRIGAGSDERLLVTAISVPIPIVTQADPEVARRLEEQLWSSELRVSELESQVEQLLVRLDEAERNEQTHGDVQSAARAQLLDPLRAVVRASLGVAPTDVPEASRQQVGALRSAVERLTVTFDAQFGTNLAETIETGVESLESRFHVATFLDEIAISMSQDARKRDARIDVRVQPSLPRWLHGNVIATRAAIYQMVEIARLVASDRPLVLAARQDTSSGRSVQVRFEVEIPPPRLDEGALATVRGCLGDDAGPISEALAELAELASAPAFDPLDVELVTVERQATVLRCSAAFDVAEEPETDHSWVRGLRTLIVQSAATTDNGIQAALGAFGIIGYVVTDEKDLIEALRIAEEYANPYRFVLADVDTPDLEEFIGQLFDGDAPVVLVGTESESAMVAALSTGYDGYLAKPVRQVDLLEVILSTVEPPGVFIDEQNRANAA